MTFIAVLKELWKRRILVGIAILVAVVAATLSIANVSLFPPSVSKRSSVEAKASNELLVDSARSPLAGSRRDITGLVVRAAVFARLMSSGDVVEQMAKEAGIPQEAIAVTGPVPLPGEAPGITEGSEALPYGLDFTSVPEQPIVSIATRAPTVADARALAAAAPEALRELIRKVQQRQDTPPSERVEVRKLGPPQAGLVDGGPSAKIAAAVFLIVLLIELGLILGIPRLVAGWRQADTEEDELAAVPDVTEIPPTARFSDRWGSERQSDHAGRLREKQP
ncbi:MAG: hypothetical protein QOH18_394 [Solirubrobacterales bacterium]|nr:hypothetical protein [Solirubrobacterales bacterium]